MRLVSLYPIFVTLTDKLCVVVGGGQVATRKATGLLTAGASVTVISPQASEQLQDLHEAGQIVWKQREYREGDLTGAALVFAATNREDINLAVCREAKQRGVWVNDAMSAERSSFQLPATYQQGGLQIAVSTSGASPLLARTIRDELASTYDVRYARLVELLSLMRRRLQAQGASEEEKRAVFARCMRRKERLLQMMSGDYREGSLAMLVDRLLDDESE